MATLNAKQKRFCEEYLIDLNATQAAIRAGYSEKTAYSQGQRLLRHSDAQSLIQKLKDKRSKRTDITADRVLAELAKVGFSDVRNVLTKEGNLTSPTDWDDETAGAIASIEVVTLQNGDTDEHGNKQVDHLHKIKTWDKLGALDKLGKHLGMFPNKHEHTSPDGSMTPQLIIRKVVDPKANGTND